MDPLFQILKRLSDHGAEYVLIGGMAAIVLGSPMVTRDIDVCSPMTDENLDRIHAALQGINPRFRFRPDKMRLFDDPARIHGFKNLNLTTDLGVIDILGEVSGIGTYADLAGRTVQVEIEGLTVRVIDLDTLIAAKRAAGRDKDRIAVYHLEAIKKARERGGAS